MTAHVSSFDSVKIGDFDYLFFIVCWNELQTDLTKELEEHFVPFGSDIGHKGVVVKAFKRAYYSTAEEMEAKKWPEGMRKRFDAEQDPFMLIINTSFGEFGPEQHPWGIIWFSDFRDQPDRIYRIFGELGRKTRKGEDIFQYLHSTAMKDSFRKLAKYFEIKPQIFGVAIAAKAIFEDVTGIISGS